MNYTTELRTYRISAFDFAMFLHEKVRGSRYESAFDAILDRLVADAVLSTIDGEPLNDWLGVLTETLSRVNGLGATFQGEIMSPAVLSYVANAGFGETEMRDWLDSVTQGQTKNRILLMVLGPEPVPPLFCSPPQIHILLTQYKIPRKFVTSDCVYLQSILDLVPDR